MENMSFKLKRQIPNESQSVTGIEEAMYFTIIISLSPHISANFLTGRREK